jgi:hypothetical protein
VWPDDENGVGLFEPVGTRPEFRRRGLGTAVCMIGLQRLYEEGMRYAVVGCDTPPACALRVARLPAELDDHLVRAVSWVAWWRRPSALRSP